MTSREGNMAMKARTLRRHFRESFKSLLRNGWMTFASASAVTVTLILVGVFFAIMMNLNKVAEDLEKQVEIRVHIDVAATQEDQKVLEQKIKAIPEVKSVQYSHKDKELDNLIESFGEDGEAYKLFEQDNPLSDVYVVKTKDPADTIKVAEQIEKLDFAAKVKYGQGSIEKLFSFINLSRNIGLVLIIGLLFTAMFLISNTIKITIMARKREIEIMRLVGATNAFIRWPFFLEGFWLGVLGAVLPIVLVSTSYQYVLDFLTVKLKGMNIELLQFNPFVYQLSGLLLLIGALIGVWGSLMSVRKFLKV